MATYIPNAAQTTEPVESRTVESAALEFRTLKASINGRIGGVQAALDAETAARIAGDANLQTQNNAQDVRLTAIENALPFIGEGGLPGTVYVQRLSGTGAQTVFTLNAAPQSNNVVDIYINGLYQNKDTFTVSGADVIFSKAPPAGTNNIEVQVTATIALGETDASLVTYGGTTVAAQLDAISTAGGSSLVGFQQAGAGAVARTVQGKLREVVSVKDFGAVGDGFADDTAAFNAAIAYMQSSPGHPVYVPPGVYITDPFQIGPTSYNAQAFFYGSEAASTVIRRRGTGAGEFITIGNTLATVFQANYVVRGLTIDGGAITNGPALVSYDLVRSTFKDVIVRGGSRAYVSYGGIANSFYHCKFQDSARGVMIDGFAAPGSLSPAGGGWPNLLRFTDCHFVDNTEWGLWVDRARMIVVDKCQIEGNGVTLGASTGGVYVGTGIGDEVEITDPESIGLIVRDTWFEANRGIADIHLNSGINSVAGSNFFSHSTMVTNDIRVDGGRYRLRELNMSFGKTANVLEGAEVGTGNVIAYVQAAALSFRSSKTSVETGRSTFLGNGAVPGVNGATAPLIQHGIDSSGVNPTISFNQVFKAGTTPRVYVSPVNNSSGTIEAVEVYAISNTGFTIRKKSFNGTAIGTSNYSVSWVAIGENP